MGVETSEGLQTDDIISALKGHIKKGYMVSSKHIHFSVQQ